MLLAFQRLQWYDQGFIPHPFVTHIGNGQYGSSPDSAGHIYYGDDEKEIGLFKFKLGLFKFVLPTFSKDDASWERTKELSSLMRVPPPAHKRRQSNENIYSRLKAQTKMHSKISSEERGVSLKGNAVKSSIAYVVIMPHVHKFETSDTNGGKKGTSHDDNARIVQQRATAFSKSIAKAHENSIYNYQLYAMVWGGGPDSNEGPFKQTNEALLQSGFTTMDFDADPVGLDDVNTQVMNPQTDQVFHLQHSSLRTLLTRHDVIVQGSLNSILLKPMDYLFGILLNGVIPDDSKSGIVDAQKSSIEEGKSNKQSKQGSPRSNPTQIHSFALDSFDSHVMDGNGLYIFRTSFRDATDPYLKHLRCMSDQSNADQVGLHGGGSSNIAHSNLRLSLVARKNQEISMESKQSEVQCRILLGKNTLHLDRCVYDVGNFDSRLDCSNVNVKDDAKLAYFPDETNAEGFLETEGDVPQKHDDSKSHISCGRPWECSDLDDCVGKNGHGHGKGEVCKWLHSEWFTHSNNKK